MCYVYFDLPKWLPLSEHPQFCSSGSLYFFYLSFPFSSSMNIRSEGLIWYPSGWSDLPLGTQFFTFKSVTDYSATFYSVIESVMQTFVVSLKHHEIKSPS